MLSFLRISDNFKLVIAYHIPSFPYTHFTVISSFYIHAFIHHLILSIFNSYAHSQISSLVPGVVHLVRMHEGEGASESVRHAYKGKEVDTSKQW